jgi:hypothetical protein
VTRVGLGTPASVLERAASGDVRDLVFAVRGRLPLELHGEASSHALAAAGEGRGPVPRESPARSHARRRKHLLDAVAAAAEPGWRIRGWS